MELIAASERLRLALGQFSAVAPDDSQARSAQRLADALRSLEGELRIGEAQQTLDRLDRSVLETLPAQLRRLRESLQADVVTLDTFPADLTRRWVSTDGAYRVEVTPKENLDDPAALARFVSDVQSVAPEATDSAVLNLESGNTVARAFRQAMIVAFVVVLLVLWFMFRRLSDPLVVIAPLLLALGLTAATMVLIGLPFNYANIITLPLLLGIGVDSGIHMVHRSHVTRVDNVQLLRTSTTRAVVTSTLTMTCSFGNLAFSPHRGTASMGIVLTMGMLYVLVCTLALVPALLATVGNRSTMHGGTQA
jgi:predicted RND superfamily exporter protein